MKKIIFAIFIIATSFAHSQIIKDYGLKIGGTLANLNWDYSKSVSVSDLALDNKLGLNIGGFIESTDIAFFRIVAEINYTQKGTEKELPITTPESPIGKGNAVLWKVGLNYVNISLLVKPNINLGILKPYLLIGPRLDLEVSQSIENDASTFYKKFNKNRMGLKMGIGSEFKLLNLRLLAEFVYDMDFKELYKNENVEITSKSFDFRIGIYL